MGESWLKRLFGRGDTPGLLVLRDPEIAGRIPVQTPLDVGGVRRADAGVCPSCGGALHELLVTTHGGELWRERPIAVDGFRCVKCGHLSAPRFLEQEEIEQLQADGIKYAQEGQLDEAEVAFRRICNSWPRYAGARVHLATLQIDRADAEAAEEARPAVVNRLLDMAEAQLRDALRGEQVPRRLVAMKLVQLQLRREAEGKALQAIDELAASSSDEPTARAVSDLQKYVAERGDLFERGAACLRGRIKVKGELFRQPDERGHQRMRDGVELMLRHQRANPSSWQALWLAGKTLQALGDFEGAARELGRAFAMQPQESSVGREYVMALVDVGRIADAVPVAEAACAAVPDDAGLVANRALVLLLAGRLDESMRMVDRAQRMDPHDMITHALARFIGEIERGKRPQPKSLAELFGG